MKPLTLDRELFDRLANSDGRDLVSIFMPSHSKGRDVAQDRIRLKNLLAGADTDLEDLGFKPRQRETRLQNAHDLLDDREFWEHQGAGLAVYIDDEGAVTPVSLSYPVDESVIVMSLFLIRPLLEELTLPEVQVLALAKGEVGFFVVQKNGARRVVVDLPESFDDVNWFVDRESQRQQHPDRTDSSRARHGHDPSAGESEDVNRFLREVDRALPGSGTLIVLGDDDLASRFEDVSDRHVISPPNSGLRSPFAENEIQESALPVFDDLVSDRETEAMADAKEQLGLGQATTNVSEAMEGALTGRVSRLVVHPAVDPVWGRIDESTLDVMVHDDRQHADVDLVDRVVALSMQGGADVMPLRGQSNGHPLIAVMRF